MIRLLTEARPLPGFSLSRSELRPLMADILRALGLEDDSLTLRLVDDAEIARLNKAYLGCFGPTNVLSFPARNPDGEEPDFDPEDLAPCCEDPEEWTENLEEEPAPWDDGEDAEPDREDAEEGTYLGEIALSVDTLAREARLYGQDPREHLIRLLVHATLHLTGLDHGPEMEALTEAALDALA